MLTHLNANITRAKGRSDQYHLTTRHRGHGTHGSIIFTVISVNMTFGYSSCNDREEEINYTTTS